MRYRQHRLESPGRLLGRALQRLLRRGYVKTQRAYRVELGDASVKRLVLADSFLADRLSRNLRALAGSPVVPRLIASFENEVWVEFLEGSAVDASDPRLPQALARLFAEICGRAPRRACPRELGLDRELQGDLGFLGQVGVLAPGVAEELAAWTERSTPESVWIGHDYSDPRPSNFLWSADGELRITDVESLVSDRLIGRGVAKALVSWMAPRRGELLAALRDDSPPGLLDTFPFVELHFLASWQKRSVLQRKERHVQRALFERFRGDGAQGGS